MTRTEQIKATYNGHIIKAELAAMDAYEQTDLTASDDQLALAIHHLQTAKTQLETLRKTKPQVPERPTGY